jgi:hypothetical protein
MEGLKSKIKKSCDVCTAPIHPLAKLCKRCKKIIDRVDMRKKPDKLARIDALKRAWDGEAFRCYYSGVVLNENDHKNPRYLTFDHRIPRKEDDLVVASSCINDMKSDMTEQEFRDMVIALSKRFEGGHFDSRAFELEHWKR